MLSVTNFKSANKELIQSNKFIVLAYSGGLDSSVLLHLIASCIDHKNLLVWHINHQLQESSKMMEQFCQQQAALKQLAFRVSHLSLTGVTSNIEARAREARYDAFSKKLNSKTDVLLTAHHADDQFETLLLNMCRGTGVSGLRGIGSDVNINNISTQRPLLSYSRLDLETYADANNIEWVDDPTNVLSCYDRNYIRHEIAPLFKQRWPSVNESFLQVSKHQKEASECLNELALIDYETNLVEHEFSPSTNLSISSLKKLSIARQKNVIRYWLMKNDYVITMNQLNRLVKTISVFENEIKKILIKNGFIALFDNTLFCVFEKNIKQRYEVLDWLGQHSGNHVCRFNKEEKAVSGHFLKRQFQSKKIPPWLRDQTIFELNENSPKHVINVYVL